MPQRHQKAADKRPPGLGAIWPIIATTATVVAGVCGFFHLQLMSVKDAQIALLKESRAAGVSLVTSNIIVNKDGSNLVRLPYHRPIGRQAEFNECEWYLTMVDPYAEWDASAARWSAMHGYRREYTLFQPRNIIAKPYTDEQGNRCFLFFADVEWSMRPDFKSSPAEEPVVSNAWTTLRLQMEAWKHVPFGARAVVYATMR